MQIIHREGLVVNMFVRDSRKVIDILKELTFDTDSKTWIKGIKCGIKATQDLQDHYDGISEGILRKKLLWLT